MAEFCDNCPLKGQLNERITGRVSGHIDYEARAVMGHGPLVASYHGDAGVFLDEYGNTSEVVYFPLNRTFDQMVEMVDVCDGPVIETRGIVRKKDYITDCSALGRFACHEPEIITYMKDQLR